MTSFVVNCDYQELMKNLISKGAKVDLVVTDPPYDIPSISGGGSVNKVKKLNKSLQDLDQSGLMNSYKIEPFANSLMELQKGNINAYFWCNKKQIPEYLTVYVDFLNCKFDILTWHKTNALPTYSNKYLSDTEYCLYFHKGKGKCFPSSYEDAKTYWINPINHKDKKIYGHPTIKPLDFIEKIIKNSSRFGDVVLDPFMGSGTTGVACERLCRHFIGCDLDPHWYEVAKERIKNG